VWGSSPPFVALLVRRSVCASPPTPVVCPTARRRYRHAWAPPDVVLVAVDAAFAVAAASRAARAAATVAAVAVSVAAAAVSVVLVAAAAAAVASAVAAPAVLATAVDVARHGGGEGVEEVEEKRVSSRHSFPIAGSSVRASCGGTHGNSFLLCTPRERRVRFSLNGEQIPQAQMPPGRPVPLLGKLRDRVLTISCRPGPRL